MVTINHRISFEKTFDHKFSPHFEENFEKIYKISLVFCYIML